MSFPRFTELSPKIEAVRDRVKHFMATDVLPTMDRHEKRGELARELGAHGWRGPFDVRFLPEEVDGACRVSHGAGRPSSLSE